MDEQQEENKKRLMQHNNLTELGHKYWKESSSTKTLQEALNRKRWKRVTGYGKASQLNSGTLVNPEDEMLSLKFCFIINSVN